VPIFHKGRRELPVNKLLIALTGWVAIPGMAAEQPGPAAPMTTETMVVTASRTPTAELTTVGNITQLSAEQIGLNNAIHPYELAVQVPGVWVGRGSGQEHLTAIRSPVLTGPGSCGAFLIMEDNIPTRPTGFCNVNQMFEVPTVLADRIEVIRGPANSLYGSNGLHGTVNTLLPEPGTNPGTTLSVETGSNHYWRGELLWDSGPAESAWNVGLVADSDGGYRDNSGYDQAKFFAKNRRELTGGVLTFNASGSWLDQDTAGFITGEDAYKKADRFRNENPDAYRDAWSVRTSVGWTPDAGEIWAPEYRFFLRYSDMDFLMHFLPGQPKEENDQISGGFNIITRRDIGEASNLALGFDGEIAQGTLEQFQEGPDTTFGMPRPEGQQYDYEVTSYLGAVFANITTPLNSRWELQAGLRAEYMYYDYDNKMISGNSKENADDCAGAPVGTGGCLYSRPKDRNDDFFNLAPNAGLLYRFNDETVGFVNAVHGFRVPQATELYRLEGTQKTADIDSVEIDSIETGLRHLGESLSLETVLFYMKKRNDILKDSSRVISDDGKTKHYGIETKINWRIINPVYLDLVGSFSKQKYDFNEPNAGGGESIKKGDEIDTSPQILASARLGYEYGYGIAELEWVYNDEYYLDAANTEEYEGHSLFNARITLEASETWSFALRVTNLTDEKYADRADLSSFGTGTFRYFPGHEREVYAQVTWRTE
jgi:outer membrane receptor protein involved in Fe transport